MKIRFLSLWLRRHNSRQECLRTLRTFDEWRQVQKQLGVPQPRRNRVLLIRLDDIGDYLLFRNQLASYKGSTRWGSHTITLLANASWRELFGAFDADTVDQVIWVDKREYLASAPYRWSVWANLRDQGFETVIAPARTRPLLLDDLCCLAAAPLHRIGSANTYVHAAWNELSDGLYETLLAPPDTRFHEFLFNGQFTAWICGAWFAAGRPVLDTRQGSPVAAAAHTEVICFIGANTRSRRWPAKRWIEFIKLYGRRHPGRMILAGSGHADEAIAARILKETCAESIVGRISMQDLVSRVAGAQAVVSNDTMGAHLGVSCGRPTVIIANGVNYQRFTDYKAAGINGVSTCYPRVFTRKRERNPRLLYHYSDALTADVAAIAPAHVLRGLEEVLTARPPTDET